MLKESLRFLNPCTGIIETRTSPHSHVLRTSFLEKCGLALGIYVGHPFETREEQHVGVFDYLTGFIPLGLLCLVAMAWGSKNLFLNFVVFPILFLINLPFLLARLLFGLAATLVTSMTIIPIVHAVAWLIKGRDLKESAGKLKVVDKQNQLKDLKTVLQVEKEDIANLKVEEKFKNGVIIKYELCSMLELPDMDLQKAEKGKIYLAKNGDYYVRKNEQIMQGSLASYETFNEKFSKDGVLSQLNNPSFKGFVLRILNNENQLEKESGVYFQFKLRGAEFKSLFFPLNQSTIDSIPSTDKLKFDDQRSALRALLGLNPNQITKNLEKEYFSSDSDASKVCGLYMSPFQI